LVSGFLLFVYVVFPAIASGTTGKEVYVLSGLDYLVVLLFSGSSSPEPLRLVGVALVVNALYCAALALVTRALYRRLSSFAESIL
jgi:hypothetical protein